MTGVAFAAAAAYGTFLLYTGIAFGWRGLAPGPRGSIKRCAAPRVRADIAAATAALAAASAGAAYAFFGGVFPPLVAAAGAAYAACGARRAALRQQRAAAFDAWPRLIEHIRTQASALGRSIPQALFDAGRHAPAPLLPRFAAAERVWLVTTDFQRTVRVLQSELADAGADAVLETLLVAHEIGGREIDRRLAALVEDRTLDLQHRKDARAKQAGVRFARRFVLVVPVGMALAGMSIGSGRDAYDSVLGQFAVAVGIAVIAACWTWAGRLMALPEEVRVFGAER